MPAAPSAVDLSLTPLGHLRVEPGLELPLDASTAAQVVEAFGKGPAAGLLLLATDLLTADLPAPLAYWQKLARLLLTHLCGIPDLESQRQRLSLPAPAEELALLLAAAPPMRGGEYLTLSTLEALWGELEHLVASQLAEATGTAEEFLRALNPAWNLVGRVCFHLAENKRDQERPFAFLATYTSRLSGGGKPAHLPLGRALEEYSGAGNKQALLALLRPVQRAAEESALARELVDSGEVFHPLAWTPADAHRFLVDLPKLEAAGVLVRVPDWWKAKHPPRPEVRVTIGGKKPSGLGLTALLDFKIEISLEGERLSAAELRSLLQRTSGLALIRGRWVEVDRERLQQVLGHWKEVEAAVSADGLSFAEGLRLLAGAGGLAKAREGDAAGAAEEKEWTRVVAGDWLSKTLDELGTPAERREADPGPELKATLRPYQRAGVAWLWLLHRLGLGACLADDMGLGKTVQVLALLLLRVRQQSKGRALLVVPASLIANWTAEAARFAPSLSLFVLHPSALAGGESEAALVASTGEASLTITTYAMVSRYHWLRELHWGLVVLDEAQAIKNPGAKQTGAVKALRAAHKLVLTGTPVENRLSDLWSLFDFVSPGLLGSAAAFSRFVKREEPYQALRQLVRPYILRRLKSDKSVIADLPEKTEVRAFCPLSKPQAALYQEAVTELSERLEDVDGIKRRGVVLAFLMRFKQICNHPSQWLGDGAWEPEASGKFIRLRELAEEIAARQEKALVFTQFREMTTPLAHHLEGAFGKPGLVLHGETKVAQRKVLVDQFQREDGPPFFVLSLKAGGTGLNLTAASHVIHFDRWWNPAVEDQATDRAFRIGQKKNVLVHKFVCRGTVEEKVDRMIEEKKAMARELLGGGGESVLTELGNDELISLVKLDLRLATQGH